MDQTHGNYTYLTEPRRQSLHCGEKPPCFPTLRWKYSVLIGLMAKHAQQTASCERAPGADSHPKGKGKGKGKGAGTGE